MTASQIMSACDNRGRLEPADGAGSRKNEFCGITIYIRVKDGVVSEASFEASGCVEAEAAASLTAAALVGKTPADILQINRSFAFYNIDDLPRDKIFVSPMAAEAARTAAADCIARSGGK